MTAPRALALIDGEHYASVVRDALAALPYDFVGACMLGGTEKLRGEEDYGVPVVADFDAALAEFEPDLVVDLSDEPVLGPRERFALAGRTLAAGRPYVGADFRLEPPQLAPFPLPSVAVIGTGKRVGKTAVTSYLARLLAADRDVVVVAMGRGGPAEPDVVAEPPTPLALLELSRSGSHAASDYLEIAALARVVTVGCRRCGGGLAGAPSFSNVAEGADVALRRRPDVVLFDGSGATLPPVATRARVLVANAHQEPALVTGYLNGYRLLISDLVVLTMAEDGDNHEALRDAIAAVAPNLPVVATVLRPRPVEPVEGRRVAYFTTAPERTHERLAQYLADEHGADVIHVSSSLARRDRLREELGRVDADVYLTEIKAAAIDVVAEAGAERGVDVVFADNDVLSLPGEPELEAELRTIADGVLAAPGVR